MNINSKIKKMTTVSLAAAIICILGPLSITIPISPVPIAICIFGIYIAAYVLGSKWGTLAVLIYLLIGLIGVPVFSAFSGGPGKLLGPTGGYLIGYIPLVFVAGLFIEKFEGKIYMHVIGMLIGLTICYIMGTAWLAIQASLSFTAALSAGVIPFIPADIVKIILAVIVGVPLRKATKKMI